MPEVGVTRRRAGVPEASSDSVRKRMQTTPRRDTGPELALRSELHRRGLRYFVDRKILPGSRRRADLVFTAARVAVFVDGCFWHACPEHMRLPSSNRTWWKAKLEGNRTRDTETDSRLSALGWISLRVWEHEAPTSAADRVESVIRRRTGARSDAR